MLDGRAVRVEIDEANPIYPILAVDAGLLVGHASLPG
jgi:hypothetical protein